MFIHQCIVLCMTMVRSLSYLHVLWNSFLSAFVSTTSFCYAQIASDVRRGLGSRRTFWRLIIWLGQVRALTFKVYKCLVSKKHARLCNMISIRTHIEWLQCRLLCRELELQVLQSISLYHYQPLYSKRINIKLRVQMKREQRNRGDKRANQRTIK